MLARTPPRSPYSPYPSIDMPLPKPKPTHVCDAKCGFEGTKDEVLRHEKDCEAWRAWKQIQLARRRDSERKRREARQDKARQDQARQQEPLDADYLCYIADVEANAACSTADGKRQHDGTSAASSSRPGKRQRAREETAAKKLAAEARAAQEEAARQSHLATQKQLFLERTQADTQGFAKHLEASVPEFWTADAGEREEVPRDSVEFKKIQARFVKDVGVNGSSWPKATYKIERLFRIVQNRQWTAFEMRRWQTSQLQEDPVNLDFVAHPFPKDAELLWHGTAAGAAAKIQKDGFNRSAASGKAVLGRGVYFSTSPRLCLSGEKDSLFMHVYTPPDQNGFKHLLLCNVHLGNSVKGHASYHTFPPAVHSTVDSLTDVLKVCVQHDNSINVLYQLVVSWKH